MTVREIVRLLHTDQKFRVFYIFNDEWIYSSADKENDCKFTFEKIENEKVINIRADIDMLLVYIMEK